MRYLLLFFVAAVLVLPGVAHADQIELKNGDRVTGTIIKKDAKTLTLKADQFGVISVAWDQVVSIRADKPVHVVLKNGKPVSGTLATTEGKVELATADTKMMITPADIVTMRNEEEQAAYDRLQHPGWTRLWAGSGSVGLAGTAGNARTLTFTTGVTAARIMTTDKTSIYFNTIKASATANGKDSETAQAVRGGVGYDHNLKPRLFVNVFNDYETDKFQNLDLRFVLGGGFGFHAIKKERSHLDILGGGDFNHSSFSTPLTQKSAEAYWGDDYARKIGKSASMVQTFRMFNDLTNTGDFRANFDVGTSMKVAKWLNWNVSISDRYLNRPAEGRKTNDLLYTTGLGITFAR